MKMNFDNFQIKVETKNGVICLVFFFVSRDMVLKLPKIVHFFENCADLSKKSKSINVIYLCPSKRPHHTLSENCLFFSSLGNSSEDIEK